MILFSKSSEVGVLIFIGYFSFLSLFSNAGDISRMRLQVTSAVMIPYRFNMFMFGEFYHCEL